MIDQWQLYQDDLLKIILPPYSGLGVFGGFVTGDDRLHRPGAATTGSRPGAGRTSSRRACSRCRRSVAGATSSTRSCTGRRRRCRGASRSTAPIGSPTTRATTFPLETTHFHPLFLYESLSAADRRWSCSSGCPAAHARGCASATSCRSLFIWIGARAVPARVPAHRQLAARRHPDGAALRRRRSCSSGSRCCGPAPAGRAGVPRRPARRGLEPTRRTTTLTGAPERRRGRRRRRHDDADDDAADAADDAADPPSRRPRPPAGPAARRRGPGPGSARRRSRRPAAAPAKASTGWDARPRPARRCCTGSCASSARCLLFGVFRFRIETSGQEHLPRRRLPAHRRRTPRLDGPVRRDARAARRAALLVPRQRPVDVHVTLARVADPPPRRPAAGLARRPRRRGPRPFGARRRRRRRGVRPDARGDGQRARRAGSGRSGPAPR